MEDSNSVKVPILLVTANVGSLFEDVKSLLPGWVREMQQKIAALDHPKFIAFHFQEIGGKLPQAALDSVHQITNQLLCSQILSEYSTVVGYFDQDYKNDEKFTALGALFLVHKSLRNIAIWNYSDCRFEKLKQGLQIHTSNLDALETIDKLKYPKRFFPQMKWSRKGYLKTKWRISGTIVNLINIHLFHDPSNLVSMESSPSVYAKNRQNAFEYVLQGLGKDHSPAFIFGDFNFRLDQCKFLKMISKHCSVKTTYTDGNEELSKLVVVEKKHPEKVRLVVEPSKFFLHFQQVLDNNASKLRKFDKEVQTFRRWLYEFPIEFPPSYPFKEDAEITKPLYLEKRCPSWCDRVLLTHNCKEIILEKHLAKYDLDGLNTCMGDHKPVSLYLVVAGNEDSSVDPVDVVDPGVPILMLETSV
ncbi:type I inositol 1,4,5-trisphosphate 5-phosphatase-like [Dendronephthya gigantea]|uniref:type I inositol 1,4,5-trisphosphate 5-phosphatase-like n=1 Tax=Dendronephthya gigantea TaxID=151771 RepID=UPI00106B1B1D|nr:type I inositol 1,4,5-trisphosphate 5-phosphatase-like [Dendronephthya gigantea]